MTYKPSYTGIGEMLCAPFMQAEMRRRAEKVKEYAEATAPYDPDDKDNDHYRDHFSVSSGVQEGKTRRAVGTVTNDHVAALSIEAGTKDTDAHWTLTRALDAARD